MREAGFGPVGRGGFLGGVLLHPVLAIDAISEELVGLADVAVWNRDNPSGQLLPDAFDPDDKPLLMAICKDYEG